MFETSEPDKTETVRKRTLTVGFSTGVRVCVEQFIVTPSFGDLLVGMNFPLLFSQRSVWLIIVDA